MRLSDGRISKIGITIFFFCICFFSVSMGTEDILIVISHTLTLQSGDIITLQTMTGNYLRESDLILCGLVLGYTQDNKPDADSEFIVEIANATNNQLRLRARNSGLYLRYVKGGSSGGMTCPKSNDYIQMDDENISANQLFTVIKKSGRDKIALKASSGGLLIPNLKGFSKPEAITDQIVVVHRTPEPMDEVFCIFIVNKTGSDYEQSVSDIKFNESSLTVITNPTVLAEATEINNGTGRLDGEFEINKKFTTINKFAFERGIELERGSTISANCEIAGFGSVGGDVSTTVTSSSKDTREYEEQVETTVGWKQTFEVPANKRIKLKLIGNMAVINVPFTANVTVTPKDLSSSYTYPIKGIFKGTRILNFYVEKTEETLNQTQPVKQRFIADRNNTIVVITHNPYNVY